MIVKPYFYDAFECKADKCTDTCCSGWEVDIDEYSYEKYMNIKGDFGKRLSQSIVNENDSHHFKLCSEDRCPFLNENNLCDIYTELGEDGLCDICYEHPRFYNETESVTEMGLGLCCECVCELLFASENNLTFIVEKESEDDCMTHEDDVMFQKRQHCFNILYDRNFSLEDRTVKLFDFAGESNYNIRQTVFDDVINIMLKTEPINDEWQSKIEKIRNEFVFCTEFLYDEIVYEQLFTYMIYRYFHRTDIKSLLKFCVFNLLFIYILDSVTADKNGNLSFKDRINNVKLWSQQIEYSEENLDLIFGEAQRIIK